MLAAAHTVASWARARRAAWSEAPPSDTCSSVATPDPWPAAHRSTPVPVDDDPEPFKAALVPVLDVPPSAPDHSIFKTSIPEDTEHAGGIRGWLARVGGAAPKA